MFSSSLDAGLKSDCAGSHMRLTLDKVLAVGNELQIEATSKLCSYSSYDDYYLLHYLNDMSAVFLFC